MHEKRNKYLMKNTIIFAIGNIGTKFISFFLVPLYTNVLSTNDYGTIDLIYTISIVAVSIVTFNIAEAIMRFSLDKDADYDNIFSTGAVLFLISIFLSLIIFPICNLFESIGNYSLFVYIYIISLASCQISLAFLRGKELLLNYSIGNIVNAFCIAILNILFLSVFKWGIRGYFLAYIIANLITSIYAMIAGNVKKSVLKFNFDLKLTKEMLIFSVVLIPNTFMWWIMNSSDRIMVTAFIGASANGIYAVAYKIPTILSSLTTIFTQAWSYSAIKESSSNDKEDYSNTIYRKMLQIVLVLGTGLLLVIKPLMRVYVSAEYYEAWRYTPYLIVGFIFMTLGTFLATSYTVYKDSRGFLLSGLTGAVINVVLNWILIPLINVDGAALATCISYFFVFVYRVFDTRKYLRINIFVVRDLLGFCVLIVASIFIYNEKYSTIIMLFCFALEVIINYSLFKEIIITVTSYVRNKMRE